MADQLQEAISLLKTDITCWNHAAQQCQDSAAKLSGREQAEYMLLCAVYRERAKMLSAALEQLAASNRQPSNGQSVLQNPRQATSI